LSGDTRRMAETAEIESPIPLYPYQVAHFQKLVDIFLNGHIGIDTSTTGAGKSITAAAVARVFGFKHIIIICPKSVKVSWTETIAKTELTVENIITYQSLRGLSGRSIKHPYLTRFDRAGEGTIFAATQHFRGLLQEGVFLIFDEVQNIKNNSDQMKAAKALITALLGDSTKSRVLFLSASPFDKEEHAINFLRCLGFIRHRNLYSINKDTGECKLQGAQELIDMCNYFDARGTRAVVDPVEFSKRTIQPMCYQLFCEVLKPKIFSSMSPPRLDVVKDIKNGYYHLDDPVPLLEAIDMMSRAAHYRKDDKTVDSKNADWSAITRALMALETAKLPIFTRLALKRLMENDTNQVIVFVNYRNSITSIANALQEFAPMILCGDTSDRDREAIINAFQSASRRLLISNMKVGGVGINLHDIMGGRKRFVYGSPNYMAIDMHQATGRVYRASTLTSPEIRWIYGEVGREETSILNALSRKGEVLRTILDRQVEDGVQFPGQYESQHYAIDQE